MVAAFKSEIFDFLGETKTKYLFFKIFSYLIHFIALREHVLELI